MNNLRVVIIEDEIPASRLLLTLLKRLRPAWQYDVWPGTVSTAIQRFDTNQPPDLLFLDIHLSDGNAFSFLEQVRPTCAVIFTTAYDRYALRAFEVNSIDYLLKPFDAERLEAAIRKFETFNLASNNVSIPDLTALLESFAHPDRSYRKRLLIHTHERFFPLEVEEVAYFYSENRVTFAVTHSGTEHIIDLTLDRLTSQLNPADFFRANRQYVVQLSAIKRVEAYTHGKALLNVEPRPREAITVSRDRVSELRQWMDC